MRLALRVSCCDVCDSVAGGWLGPDPVRVFPLTCIRARVVSVLGRKVLKQDVRQAEWVTAMSGEELTGPSSSATMADSVPHVILIRRPV